MDTNDIKLLQEVQMQIMDEIHRVCVKNNLRYYLIGGSAIGAKRHKGIIPWDLDIDIAMPRPDYQKLIEIFPQQCDSRFCLHYYMTIPNFNSPHILICLNDSTIIFDDNEINERYGIFVDVLPLDQCPNNKLLRWKQAKDIQRTWNIIKYQRLKPGIQDSIVKKGAKWILKTLCSGFTRDYINRRQQQIMMRYDNRTDCTHWCSMASHYAYKKLAMPKKFFGTPMLMEFSGREYCVPEMIEDYLTHLFGDYNKIPSNEKQKEQMNMVKYASWRDKDGHEISVGQHTVIE